MTEVLRRARWRRTRAVRPRRKRPRDISACGGRARTDAAVPSIFVRDDVIEIRSRRTVGRTADIRRSRLHDISSDLWPPPPPSLILFSIRTRPRVDDPRGKRVRRVKYVPPTAKSCVGIRKRTRVSVLIRDGKIERVSKKKKNVKSSRSGRMPNVIC